MPSPTRQRAERATAPDCPNPSAASSGARWRGLPAPLRHLLLAALGLAAVTLLMGGYVLARAMRGRLSRQRTSTVDVAALFIAYTAGQGALAALLVRLFPGG